VEAGAVPATRVSETLTFAVQGKALSTLRQGNLTPGQTVTLVCAEGENSTASGSSLGAGSSPGVTTSGSTGSTTSMRENTPTVDTASEPVMPACRTVTEISTGAEQR
jgi:hypothetical protein